MAMSYMKAYTIAYNNWLTSSVIFHAFLTSPRTPGAQTACEGCADRAV